MSGGQQQRITVARSLVNSPAIVWADEPTGALDSETSKGIMDLLVRMNEQEQQTFVLVTHDAAVAARAHRTIRMRDGRIASDESNGKESEVEELFGVPTQQLLWILLAVFGAALILGLSALRNRVSFRMAARNLPPAAPRPSSSCSA